MTLRQGGTFRLKPNEALGRGGRYRETKRKAFATCNDQKEVLQLMLRVSEAGLYAPSILQRWVWNVFRVGVPIPDVVQAGCEHLVDDLLLQASIRYERKS